MGNHLSGVQGGGAVHRPLAHGRGNVVRTETAGWAARRMVTVLAVWLAVAAGGCNIPAQFFAWMFAPRHPKKTVPAEYQLQAERLVVVPYAGTDILFHYPTAHVEVSRDVINELLTHVKDRVKSVVHYAEVIRWQESNIEWPNMSLEAIAETFKADTLLYVELERYSTVEERAANLMRGHIKARVHVVKPEAERNPVYETTVETLFPEDRPLGVLDVSERQIRATTTRLFARDVVRKFYEHEVEIKGEPR